MDESLKSESSENYPKVPEDSIREGVKGTFATHKGEAVQCSAWFSSNRLHQRNLPKVSRGRQEEAEASLSRMYGPTHDSKAEVTTMLNNHNDYQHYDDHEVKI